MRLFVNSNEIKRDAYAPKSDLVVIYGASLIIIFLWPALSMYSIYILHFTYL